MRDCVIACVCASKRKGGKLTESNLSYGASIVTHSRRNALDVYAVHQRRCGHIGSRSEAVGGHTGGLETARKQRDALTLACAVRAGGGSAAAAAAAAPIKTAAAAARGGGA